MVLSRSGVGAVGGTLRASKLLLPALFLLIASVLAVWAAPLNVTINSPQNITYASSNMELNYSLDGAADWIGFSLDGGGNVTIPKNWSVLVPVDIAQISTTGTAGFSSETWIAQAFRPTVNNLTAVSLLFTVVSSGRVNVSIRADDDNQPANLDLVNDSKIINSNGWQVFNLPVLLNASQRYWIVVIGESNTVKLNRSGSDPYKGEGFAYSVNFGQPWTFINTTDFTFMTHYILQDGHHTLTLYANESSGNVYSSSISFTVDAYTPPALTLSDPTPSNDSWETVNWIYVNASAEDIAMNVDSVLLQWDNGTLTNFSMQCGSGKKVVCVRNMSDLPDGSYAFKIFANDSAGNGNWSAERRIKLDATIPRFEILSPTNATYATSSIEFNFSVIEANVDRIAYNLDGSANITSSANASFSDLSEGAHRIALYANDSAGNSNYSIVRFTIDTKPPVANFAAPTPINDTWLNTRWIYLNITVQDNTSSIDAVVARWYEDALDYRMSCTQGRAVQCNVNLTGLSDGAYPYRIFANDSAGNWNWSAEMVVNVDATRPVLTLTSPENKTYAASSLELNFSVAEANIYWRGYSLDDGANVSLNGNSVLANLSEGSHSVVVYINDSAGNSNSTRIDFTVDTRAPYLVELHLPADSNLSSRWVLLNWTALDATTNLGYTIRLEDAEDGTLFESHPANASPYNLTDLAEGKYTVRLIALDAAGNSNSSSKNITLDTTPPVLRNASAEPDPATPGGNVTLEIEALDSLSGVSRVEARVTLPNGSVLIYDLQLAGGKWNTTLSGDDTEQTGSYSALFNATDYADNARTYNWSFEVKEIPTIDEPIMIAGGGGGGAPVESASGNLPSKCIKPGLQILNSSLLECAIKEMNLSRKSFHIVEEGLAPALALTGDKTGDYPLPRMNTSVLAGPIAKINWDPYEVAAKTALAKWNSTEEVVIARGDIEADAYAAIAYCKAFGFPLLLTKPEGLPSATLEALGRLRPEVAMVVGGETAVSKEVEWQLRKIAKVGRLNGYSREDTARDVAGLMESNTHKKAASVIIEDGNRPTIGSALLSALYGAPILYVFDGKVPEPTRRFLTKHNATGDDPLELGIVFAGEGVKAVSEVKALMGI